MQVCKPKGCLPSELSGVLCLSCAAFRVRVLFSVSNTAFSCLCSYDLHWRTAVHTNYLTSAQLTDPGGPGTKRDCFPESSTGSFPLSYKGKCTRVQTKNSWYWSQELNLQWVLKIEHCLFRTFCDDFKGRNNFRSSPYCLNIRVLKTLFLPQVASGSRVILKVLASNCCKYLV